MSSSNYYELKSHWSNSMINSLVENEISFNEWYLNGKKEPINQRYSEGQFLHSFLLDKALQHPKCENDESDKEDIDGNEYLIVPDDLDKRTKAGKEAWAKLIEGKDIDNIYMLTESSAKSIQSLVDSFWESFKPVLDDCKSFFPEMEGYGYYDGIPVKGKVDLLIYDKNNMPMLIDWKGSTSFSDFRHKCYSYNYDMQAFLYSYIFNAQFFKFYAFDLSNYNRWKEYEIGEDSLFLDRGEGKFKQKMEYVKAYLVDGIEADIFKKEYL